MTTREIPLYWIDAFATEVFRGNPAAVCPLEAWPDDELLAAIAAENGLSETAFIIGGDGEYELRWFTPAVEVELCGHATLASGFVVMTYLEPGLERVRFQTRRSGQLLVARDGDDLVLDFPAATVKAAASDPGVGVALGREPAELFVARDYLAVFETAAEVASLAPDFAAVAGLDREVIATAPGEGGIDFVSRFFAPRAGIPEDPVTGSAHCALTPFWAQKLGKTELRARQISARGGDLHCVDDGERVRIGGRAVCYMRGAITV